MKSFLRFISLIIALTGFMVAAAATLLQGDTLLVAILKALAVFTALWVVQSFFMAILGMAANSTSREGSDKS
jgi:hypothetical protein